jgi:hypothetical protein
VDTCPSSEQLQRLLADDLPPAECPPLAQHVEHCLRCQQTLETLTSDPVVRPLAPGDASAPNPLRRLRGNRAAPDEPGARGGAPRAPGPE